MRRLNATLIEEALNRLGDRIGDLSETTVGLVVCGGAALVVTGMIVRSTSDVDVLAGADGFPGKVSLIALDDFPKFLETAASDVAQAMGLKSGLRHLEDLVDLEPTASEAALVVSWLSARQTSDDFRARLSMVLERIGFHEDGG